MESAAFTIRDAVAADEAGWRSLWNAYLVFYEEDLSDAVTDQTWSRLSASDRPDMNALVAESADGRLVGMLNYVLHPITWAVHQVAYLEDLYVDESTRGRGVARALIEQLAERGQSEGWHRIYWQTARDNAQAQALYNKIAERTGWVRYDLDLNED